MRHQSGRSIVWGILFVALVYSQFIFAAGESPQSFTYQGRFLNAAGTGAMTGTADIKFTILNAAGNCILLEETHSTINLGSSGVFSLQIGTGIRTVDVDPSLTMSQIFANPNPQPGPAPVLLPDSANCLGGYTPVAGERRLLRVTVNNGIETVVLSPDQVLNSVPQSLVAETLQGIGPSGLIQVTGTITQTNLGSLTAGANSDASSLHNHDTHNDTRYVRLSGAGSQDFGSTNIYTSGKIGLGTTSPNTDLDIERSNPILRLGASAGGTSKIEFYSSSSTSTQASIQSLETTGGLIFQTSGATALTITPNQNVSFSGSIATAGTLGIGKYDAATEPTLITALTALGTNAMGTIWEYSATSGVAPGQIKYWDGTAAQLLVSGTGTYTWAQIDKSSSSLADLGVRSASDLSSGTLSDARLSSNVVLKNSSNIFSVGGQEVNTSSSNQVALKLKEFTSQISNMFEVRDPSDSVLYSIESTGTPTASTDLTNMSYVAAAVNAAGGSYVAKSGSTMTGSLIGRPSSLLPNSAPFKFQTGSLMSVSESGALEYDGTSLYLTDSNGSRQALSTVAAGNYITGLTGDITATGPGTANATIGANKVTNSMLAQQNSQTILGRLSPGTGNVETLTASQVTSLFDPFSSTLKGLVPASGGGSVNFLRADGSWAQPTGLGDMLLATPQTITGAKTFGTAGDVGKLIISGSNSGFTILDASSVASGGTVVLPNTGTLLTTTGSAANLTNFPILNQNTTGNAATVTTNANLTGDVTSVGNTTSISSQNSTFWGGKITDKTGSGQVVFNNSPTLNSPFIYGNLGVGTSTPGYMVEITKNANASTPIFVLKNLNAGTNVKNYLGLISDRAKSGGIIFGDQDAEVSGVINYDHLADKFEIGTNGNLSQVVIDSNGNLGIGTTSPTAQIEVNGQIKITGGAPGAGRVLTSDSSGLASWSAPATHGTVTNTSVVSANGFSGSVANSNTAPEITIGTTVSGITKGDGISLSAASPGVDYLAGTSLLETGLLKSTSGTGVLTIAGPSDFPILNQDTTGNAGTVTTNANLSGEVTSVGNATTVTNSAVLSKVLSGFNSGAGAVNPGDSILTAIQKLDGNIAGKQDSGNFVTGLSGDISASGPGLALATIGANKITNSMLAQEATQTFLGRGSAGIGNVEALSSSQATAILDPFSSSLKGVVPASGGGTSNYLRADGSWSTPTFGDLTGEVTSVGTTTTISSQNSSFWADKISDETGTGLVVFNTSPILSAPTITNVISNSDFTLTQNTVAPFKSLSLGAISNTLILSSGNVGIGTTNPTASLEVNGQVKINGGAPGVGRVLTSDATGLASWVEPAPITNGTVTSASVVSANGFSGLFANSSTTPALTIGTTVNGLAKGNGIALSAALPGTDYAAGTSALGTGILKSTTSTGALTIAAQADFPILNQDTTGNAATVTTNANLSGEVTSIGNATTVTNAAVLSKVLSGFNSGAGTVNPGDSILAAIQKLDGNIAGKQNSGNYITGLTGDITANGPGSSTATIGINKVTNAMLAQQATQTFLGRSSAGTGNVETLSSSQATAMLDPFSSTLKGVVPASGGGSTNYLRADGTWAPPGFGNLSGEVTSVGSATTIATQNSSFWAGKISDETGTGVLVFNNSPSITSPVINNIAPSTNFTLTQNLVSPVTSVGAGAVANTLYLRTGAVGIGTTNPGAALEVSGQVKITGGAPGVGKVLSSDAVGLASWVNPTNSGTVTSTSVVTANGFSGTVATATTTPAITIRTSITGVIKGNGTAISAATSGTDYAAGTSALATGILKSTTGTGALTIAVPADFPILNQNTTGNAATVTTNANLTGDVTSVGNATAIPAQSSAVWAGRVTDETGTGTIVFSTAPTLFSPVITNIAPGNDFTITQNTVTPFRSINAGALANTLVVKAGAVGIGSSTPTARLHLPASTAAASSAPLKITIGTLMTAPEAGAIEYDGTNLYYTNALNSRKTVNIGVSSQWTTSGANIFYSAGRVGIGTTNPTFQLQLSTDSAAKPGTTTWTIASDERLKDIRAPFTRSIEALELLHPIYFNYKTDNPLGLPSEKEYVGIRAQEVQKAVPESVSTDAKGYLNVNTDGVIWTMVNAIKEIFSKTNENERNIASIKADSEEKSKIIRDQNQEIRVLKEDYETMRAWACSNDPRPSFCNK